MISRVTLWKFKDRWFWILWNERERERETFQDTLDRFPDCARSWDRRWDVEFYFSFVNYVSVISARPLTSALHYYQSRWQGAGRGGRGGRRERAPRPLFHRTLVGPWISNQSLMKSVVAAGIYGHRSDPKVSTRAASNVPTTCNRICNFLFYRVKIRSNEIFNIIPPNRKRLDKFLRKQCDIARRDKMNALLAFFSLLCGRTRTRTWGGGLRWRRKKRPKDKGAR